MVNNTESTNSAITSLLSNNSKHSRIKSCLNMELQTNTSQNSGNDDVCRSGLCILFNIFAAMKWQKAV